MGPSFGVFSVTAVYGGNGSGVSLSFNASSCRVATAHKTVSCNTSAGYGVSQRWTVTVAGVRSNASSASLTTSYQAPSLRNVSFSATPSATLGGDTVTLQGVQRYGVQRAAGREWGSGAVGSWQRGCGQRGSGSGAAGQRGSGAAGQRGYGQ